MNKKKNNRFIFLIQRQTHVLNKNVSGIAVALVIPSSFWFWYVFFFSSFRFRYLLYRIYLIFMFVQ